eukprot:14655793-Alexandrium_andersonii.AAC.1
MVPGTLVQCACTLVQCTLVQRHTGAGTLVQARWCQAHWGKHAGAVHMHTGAGTLVQAHWCRHTGAGALVPGTLEQAH